jgi:predicted SnoaL-like aldol condensation-catalyzing enzyme
MAGMEQNIRQNPDMLPEVKQAIAETDLVVVPSHVKQKPGEPGEALMHIFWFENRRIAERWELAKPVWGILDRIQMAISKENLN